MESSCMSASFGVDMHGLEVYGMSIEVRVAGRRIFQEFLVSCIQTF